MNYYVLLVFFLLRSADYQGGNNYQGNNRDRGYNNSNYDNRRGGDRDDFYSRGGNCKFC